jgi:large subunit ribosomal protein L7/L12
MLSRCSTALAPRFHVRNCGRRLQTSAGRSNLSTAATAVASTPAQANSDTSTNSATASPRPIIWTTHRLNATQIATVDAIFHKLLWLDLFELGTLNDEINRRLGIVLTPKQSQALERQLLVRQARIDGQSLAGPGGPAAAPVEAAPVTFDLKLVGYDASAKIKVIKEVRSLAELGLKEAKEMVEGAPKVILKNLKPEQAEELKAKLEAAGGQVELV